MIKVFRKEVREMLRDKRVRSTAIFGPIFLIFVLMYMFSTIIGSVSKPQAVKVHVVNGGALLEPLRKAGFQVETVVNEAEGKAKLQHGEARLIVSFREPKDGVVPVEIFYDQSEQLSQIALGSVSEVLRKVNEVALRRYLDAHHVPDSEVAPLRVSTENVAKEQKGAGEFLIGMLPYLIVIWAFYGGMGSAADLVAGEKERNTLETLLVTPVPRTQIVLGKMLALALLCLASSLSSLVGLALFALVKPAGSEVLLKDGFGLNIQAMGITFLILLPLVAIFASLLMAISTFAKNSREAQTYLGLASFVILMPALVSQFIGLTDFGRSMWVNFVPILNSANNIRLALMGKPEWLGIGITVVSSLAIASVMILLTVRLFEREQVLAKS